MASFAAQLVDVLYGIFERLTGYSARGEDGKDAQKPRKLASPEALRTKEAVQIRSRHLDESGGSGAQVNRDRM